MRTDLPSGTVTFLFTDVEGSTQQVQRLGEKYASVLAIERKILRSAFHKYRGHEVDTQGDSFFVAFARAADAVAAAVLAERILAEHAWPAGEQVRVRMGLHTGAPQLTSSGYVGLEVHIAARLCAAAHGGQVLLSQATRDLAVQQLPEGVSVRELGEHRLKDLNQPHQIFQLIISGLPDEFPPLRTLDARPHNLPIQLTSFIGRDREITEISHLLGHTRLLTLTGAGGAGKTRLALQVAAEMIDSHDHGVWLVELAPLTEPTLVPLAVAVVLGMREQPGQPMLQTLVDQLGSRDLLLVLDNCEHLVDACARLAEALLRACPHLKILATSREGLGIGGETVWPVPSLSVPNIRQQAGTITELSQYEAVRLFVDRAVAVQPTFKLTELNGRAVAQVCRRLDGIPLAIELAAARVKVLKAAEIAARLDDRFHLLAAASRADLPRHQTLRAAIDWSYELLTDPERTLLRRMAVFAGGCTLTQAEQVCVEPAGRDGILPGQILDLLSRLVDKSLVIVDKQGSETRYHLLETIREYAQERLAASGEVEAIRKSHAVFFAAWVEQMGMELRAGPTQLDRFAQLEVEHDNIAAALEWSLGGADAELGMRVVGAIFYFWWRRAHLAEWERWVMLALPGIERVSEKTRAAMLLATAAMDWHVRGDTETSRRRSREALGIYRRLGDRRNTAWAIIWLTISMWGIEEHYEESVRLTEEAIAILRQEGDLGAVAQGLTNLGLSAEAHGDLVRAKAIFQESSRIAHEIGDRMRETIQLSNLGQVAFAEGDFEEATTLFQRQLSTARELENMMLILAALSNLSGVLRVRGDRERVAQLVGALDTLFDESGVRLHPQEQSFYGRQVEKVQADLGDEAFGRLRAQGRALKPHQAMEYAIEATAPHERTDPSRTPRQATKQEFGGLTDREREVAGLVAQGKSNREIANLLVVTERTVEKHVENILSKLGYSSRTQVATWAMEKGLAKSAS